MAATGRSSHTSTSCCPTHPMLLAHMPGNCTIFDQRVIRETGTVGRHDASIGQVARGFSLSGRPRPRNDDRSFSQQQDDDDDEKRGPRQRRSRHLPERMEVGYFRNTRSLCEGKIPAALLFNHWHSVPKKARVNLLVGDTSSRWIHHSQVVYDHDLNQQHKAQD